MEKLFSYGTLQLAQVQKSLFGRLLEGSPDELPGYCVEKLKIKDRDVIEKSGTDLHPILVETEDLSSFVAGTVFEVTDEELAKADEYEVDDYGRRPVVMASGVKAWAYAASRD